MAPFTKTSRSTSLARRALASSALLLCLTMAGTNLVSAFAGEAPQAVGAVFAADLTTSVETGESTVLVTLSSINDKDAVISDINSIVEGSVHDEFSALPVLTVDNVTPENLTQLSQIKGITAIEPSRQLQNLAFTSAEYLDWIKGTNVVSGGAALKGKDQIFGIIDSGINVNSPAFKDTAGGSRVIAQACFQSKPDVKPCPASSDPNPAHIDQLCETDGSDPGCYHGNATSALAVGNFRALNDESGTNFSIQGVAPEAKISFVRLAIGKEGSFTGTETFMAALNKFLVDAQSHPEIAPDVLNLSLGFQPRSDVKCEDWTALHVAVKALDSAGVTIVAASGNGATKPLDMGPPSCFNEVISVGATEFVRDAAGAITGEKVAAYSATSDRLDVVAPGSNLALIYPDYSQVYAGDGTSFSSPIVAGAVLLIKQANPNITRAQIASVLVSTGDPVLDPAVSKSFPRINIQKAVDAAVAIVPVTTVPPTDPPTTGTNPVTTGTNPVTTGTNPVTTGTNPVTTGTSPITTGTSATIPSTTTPVSVLGTTVSSNNGTSLPFTGSSSTQLFYSALWILMAGVALLCYKEGFTRLALARVQSRR